jgi:hypothetical protein
MKKDIVFHGLLLAQIAADFQARGKRFTFSYGETTTCPYYQYLIWDENEKIKVMGFLNLDDRIEENMAILESTVNAYMP